MAVMVLKCTPFCCGICLISSFRRILMPNDSTTTHIVGLLHISNDTKYYKQKRRIKLFNHICALLCCNKTFLNTCSQLFTISNSCNYRLLHFKTLICIRLWCRFTPSLFSLQVLVKVDDFVYPGLKLNDATDR